MVAAVHARASAAAGAGAVVFMGSPSAVGRSHRRFYEVASKLL
jgi:hypothetical protein